MEKVEKILINIMLVLLLVIVIGGSISWDMPKKRYYTPIEDEEAIEEVKEKPHSNKNNKKCIKDLNWVAVTATIYNPTEEQCDSDPLITADNSYIDLNLLKEKKIKWIAVSRDLRKNFKYGDEVIIKCDHDPSINGVYKVKDTMNSRWKNRIDILRHKEEGVGMGKWKVKMKKVERL